MRYLPIGTKNRYRKEVRDPAGNLLEVLGADERLPVSRSTRTRLVLGDLAQVEIVREVFERYVRGEGFRSIANALNARGAASPCGRQCTSPLLATSS